MKKLNIILAAVFVLLCAVPVFAAQVRVFVAGVDATGMQNGDEMGRTLQTLLASRLNGPGVIVVGSAAEADALVSGTYISIGKIYSIDAIAKTPAGKILVRAFVQGGTQDELIPSVGTLAEKLSAGLVKSNSTGLTGILTNEAAIKPAAVGNFIKPRTQEPGAANVWLSERLTGASSLMADGLTLPDGSREIFLAGENRLSYYRQGQNMKLVAEMGLKANEKIISIDTLPNGESKLDIFVTIVRDGELSSQVWQVNGDKLIVVAENLPYYFRSAGVFGGPKTLYVQSMGRNDDFYGDVAEATRSGSVIMVKKILKMPRYGTIYNFNQFRDRDGKAFTVVINPDGYLIVYDRDLKELWRSNDKFGGSELYFQREDDSDIRVSGDKYRWIFMNQRIQVSETGDVLIGKNEGFWIMGNARSYKRGAIYCLAWNGSSLEEKWRTRETQNYMPDYVVDEMRKELLILQTVQRPGIGSLGASSLSVMKIE
jgi:hypothetical protein